MEWNPLEHGWDKNEHGNTIIEVQGNRVLGKRGEYADFFRPDSPPYQLEGNYLTVMGNQAIGTLESQYFELSFKNKMVDKDRIVRYFAFGLGKELPACGNPDEWGWEHRKNCVCFHLDNFRIRNRDKYLFYTDEDENSEDMDMWLTRLENDIFGCGIDPFGKIYFTCNGKLIEFKHEFEAIDEKYENMHPFISLGMQDIEIIANFGQQHFLYNPNRSLAYAWRKETRYITCSDHLKDVTLVSTYFPDDHQPIKCHGLVLSCRSNFFKEMFENEGFKNRTIEIPEPNWQILKMLSFMYTDSIDVDDEDCGPCHLLPLAVKYKVESLEDFCTDKLLTSLDQIENQVQIKSTPFAMGTFLQIWDASLESGSKLLSKRCEDLLKENWQNIKEESGRDSKMVQSLFLNALSCAGIVQPAINRALAVFAIDTSIPDSREMWQTKDGSYKNATDEKIKQYLVETFLTSEEGQKPLKQNKGFVEEWKKLLKEKSQEFFDLFSDITIVAKGGKEIKSNRLILSLQSKVFRKMLEPGKVDGNRIEIPKFDKSIIKRAEKFLYTDSMLWHIEDINVGEESDEDDETTGGTTDNFCLRKLYGVLCFALEYEIVSLETMCLDLIFQEFSRLYQPIDIKAFWKLCQEDENKQTKKICELLIKRNWNLTKKQELIDLFPYYYWERKFLPIDCGLNYFDDFPNDIIIVSKEKEEIGCNRLLLDRRSTSKLFEPNLDDGKTAMTDCDTLAIQQMVDFIHNGEVEISSIQETDIIKCFHKLLFISLEYEMPSLEWYCAEKLTERLLAEDNDEINIGRNDLLEIWKTAVETGSKIMKGRCISFFKDNLLDILPKNVSNEEKSSENEGETRDNVEKSLIEVMMAKDKQTTMKLLSEALSFRNDQKIKNTLLKVL